MRAGVLAMTSFAAVNRARKAPGGSYVQTSAVGRNLSLAKWTLVIVPPSIADIDVGVADGGSD